MNSYAEQLARYHARAGAFGLDYSTAEALRRDAERLDTISTRECNGDLERVEEPGRVDHNGRAMIVGALYAISGHDRPGPIRYHRVRDTETPARERCEAIAATAGCAIRFQGDPRGLPLCLEKDGAELWPPIRPSKRF